MESKEPDVFCIEGRHLDGAYKPNKWKTVEND
jgi:hypothetical protein